MVSITTLAAALASFAVAAFAAPAVQSRQTIYGQSLITNGNLEAKVSNAGAQLFQSFTNHLYFYTDPANDAAVANTGSGPTSCRSGNGCLVMQVNRNGNKFYQVTVQDLLQSQAATIPVTGTYLVEGWFKCSMAFNQDNQARLKMFRNENPSSTPQVAKCACDGSGQWQYCSFTEKYNANEQVVVNFGFTPSYNPAKYPGAQWFVLDDLAMYSLQNYRTKTLPVSKPLKE